MITNEEINKNIERLIINYPAPILKEGIVFIDTPGLNVLNGKHIDITDRILRDLCDTALIVIPANMPCSKSFMKYLNDNYSDILYKFIFIVTKMDLIESPEEQKMVLSYVSKARLKEEIDFYHEYCKGLELDINEERTEVISNKIEDLKSVIYSQREEHITEVLSEIENTKFSFFSYLNNKSKDIETKEELISN